MNVHDFISKITESLSTWRCPVTMKRATRWETGIEQFLFQCSVILTISQMGIRDWRRECSTPLIWGCWKCRSTSSAMPQEFLLCNANCVLHQPCTSSLSIRRGHLPEGCRAQCIKAQRFRRPQGWSRCLLRGCQLSILKPVYWGATQRSSTGETKHPNGQLLWSSGKGFSTGTGKLECQPHLAVKPALWSRRARRIGVSNSGTARPGRSSHEGVVPQGLRQTQESPAQPMGKSSHF